MSVSRKRLPFCINRTLPTKISMVRSKKIEKMVEATASIMELASEKREVISPVLLVAKKDIGRVKMCLI